MPNRLAAESSPYLLQHKENPIDWFPWGEEALALAKKADRPIFLSVGYSSCHWCHVMAHESFEDEAVARALNRDFVSIKLDREERPDVDEIYMTAVQLATGHGGWPMSVFLTPDLKPFFAGTYFPREGRGGFPGFLSIVTGLAQAWREQRKEVEAQATEFAQGLGRVLERGAPAASSGLSMELIDSVIEALHADFDHEHGGFGGHPKFPPHSAIAFLLDYLETRPSLPSAVEATLQMAEEMARDTLLALCLGGIRDHVAGGFHRYSTDEKWLLPHFEKMLYDNAQMLASLARGARRWPGSGMLAQAAEETADWLQCDLMSPDGLFFSALDADSEGEEGKFYVWSREEVEQVLGEQAAAFCAAYGIQAEGNFLDEATHRATGLNMIHLRTPETGFTEEMALLRAARSGRVAPGLDDMAIAAWNGLAISAMSLCGRIDAAARCAEAWLARSREGLPHQIVRGVASGRGFLDDDACLADGLLDLHEATGEGRWRVEAERLAEEMIERFSDPAGGGLFYSEQGHGTPIGRTKPVMDSATPGANSVAARVLQRLGRTPEALNLLNANLGWIERMPTATESMSRVALALLAAGESGPARTRSESRVEVTLEPRALTTGPDGWAHGLVTITVPAGSHINTDDPPAKWLHPTELHVDGILGEAAFPAGDDDRYEGIIEIPIRLRPTRGNHAFELRVSFQVCTETECLSPEVQTLSGVVAGPEPG